MMCDDAQELGFGVGRSRGRGVEVCIDIEV